MSKISQLLKLIEANLDAADAEKSEISELDIKTVSNDIKKHLQEIEVLTKKLSRKISSNNKPGILYSVEDTLRNIYYSLSDIDKKVR